MTKIFYSPEAYNDLLEIQSYIRDELYNPTAAKNVLERIAKSIRLLETGPKLGTPLSTVTKIDSDYRYLVSGSYITFYRHVDDACYIDRILYGKRDYLAILFENHPEIFKD